MPTRLSVAFALLLASCGDDSSAGTSTTSGGGEAATTDASSSSGPGDGGDDGGTSTAVGATSTSQGEATSTGSGEGGTGGSQPACPAADCDPTATSCDPSCGIDQECDGIECDPLTGVPAFSGATIVAPALDGAFDACATRCEDGDVWWAMLVTVASSKCVVAYGPSGSRIELESVDMCSPGGGSCLVAETPEDASAFYHLTIAVPAGMSVDRSLFVIDVTDGPCAADAEDACAAAGCNGAGG